jgi:hypothetical protein
MAGTVAALTVACSESAVAPEPAAKAFDASTQALGGSNAKTVLGSFDLSPAGGTYRIGEFELVVPAGAVCDPSSSSYGVRHWNEACSAARRSIRVTVTSVTRRGQARIDFEPDLRFRPNAGDVVLRTSALSGVLSSSAVRGLPTNARYFERFSMLYARGSMTVNEALANNDPALVTHVELGTGLVWRRVKHFSGYLISLGNHCNPTPDAPCPTDTTPDQPTVAESNQGSGPVTVVVTP